MRPAWSAPQGLGWGPVAEQIVATAAAISRRPAPRPLPVDSISSTARANVHRRARTLIVATPSYDGKVVTQFAEGLAELSHALAQRDAGFGFSVISGHSLIGMARNLLAARFLANSDTTHLMWIDADVGFCAQDALRLLGHDLDVVAGLYPLKSFEGPAFSFHPIMTSSTTVWRDRATGCIDAEAAPGGFTLVKRHVYMQMIEAYPETKIWVTPDNPWLYDFFPTRLEGNSPETCSYLGEDLGFCKRWRAIGGQVWIDSTIKLRHHGSYAYEGDPMTMLAPVPAAAAAA